MRFLLFYFVFSLVCLALSAQSDLNKYVNTKPPNVASFEKYGNIPIDYSTGQISQSIPLYTFEIDANVSIPIDLRYSSSGLKPDEMPSWVGSGWDLMPGGYITQEIRGVDDFMNNGLRTASIRQQLLDFMGGRMSVPADKYYYIKKIMMGQFDSQPDLFSLNLLSVSGKFYYDGTELKFARYLPYVIDYQVSAGEFSVKDDKGYTFTFGAKVHGSGSIDDDPVEAVSLGGSVTWYLTKIKTPYNTEAVLEYEQDAIYINNTSSVYYRYGAIGLNEMGCEIGYGGRETTSSSSYVAQLILKRITYKGRRVEFNTTPRKDLTATTANTTAKALTSLQVFNEQNKLIKSISFTYDNNKRLRLDKVAVLDNTTLQPEQEYKFQYYNYGSTGLVNIPLSTAPDRTFGTDHWGFFNGNYDNLKGAPKANYSKLIPGVTTFTGDNDKTANGEASKIGMLQRITYPTGGYSEMEYEPNQTSYPTVNDVPPFLNLNVNLPFENIVDRSVSCPEWVATGTFTLAKDVFNGLLGWEFITSETNSFGSLVIKNQTTGEIIIERAGENTQGSEKIVLKAGTYQYTLTAGCQFAQEGSVINANFSLGQYTASSIPINVGGNRVVRIKDVDPVGNKVNIRRFEYEGAEMHVTPYYISTKNYISYFVPGDPFDYNKDCGLQYVIGADNLVSFDGYHINYRKVTEYFGENGENGKSVYNYGIQYVFADDYDLPPYPNTTNLSWRSVGLEKQETYRKSGTAFILQKEDNYEYTTGPTYSSPNTQGVKFGIIGQVMHGLEIPDEYTRYFNSAQVYLVPDKYSIAKTTKTEYTTDNTSIKTVTSYSYTDKDFLQSKTTTTGSDGRNDEECFWYTNDFNDNLANIQTLKSNHIIGLPLKRITLKGGNIVSGEVQTLDNNGNTVGSHIYENSWTPAAPTHDPAVYYPQLFNQEAAISYNSGGRVREFAKDNDVTVVLWGYANTYPVAMIKNATYETVLSVLGQVTIDKLEGGNPGTDAEVRSMLSLLRTDARLKNALVNIYTYIPLIGMSSQVTPAGDMNLYEYDGFNRLKLVRDQNGMITKQYEYGYQKPLTQ